MTPKSIAKISFALFLILAVINHGQAYSSLKQTIDLRDGGTFVISSYDDDYDDNDNELIQPQDVQHLVSPDNEEKYRPLHSFVAKFREKRSADKPFDELLELTDRMIYKRALKSVNGKIQKSKKDDDDYFTTEEEGETERTDGNETTSEEVSTTGTEKSTTEMDELSTETEETTTEMEKETTEVETEITEMKKASTEMKRVTKNKQKETKKIKKTTTEIIRSSSAMKKATTELDRSNTELESATTEMEKSTTEDSDEYDSTSEEFESTITHSTNGISTVSESITPHTLETTDYDKDISHSTLWSTKHDKMKSTQSAKPENLFTSPSTIQSKEPESMHTTASMKIHDSEEKGTQTDEQETTTIKMNTSNTTGETATTPAYESTSANVVDHSQRSTGTAYRESSTESPLENRTKSLIDMQNRTIIAIFRPTPVKEDVQTVKRTTESFSTTEEEIETTQHMDFVKIMPDYSFEIDEIITSNITYNFTDDEIEKTLKKIARKTFETRKPRNCSDFHGFKYGVPALKCAISNIFGARNRIDLVKAFSKTWKIISVWLCVYILFAVPCWCQRGWCCCCCRCNFCFPEDIILDEKRYFTKNPPGVYVLPTKKKDAPAEILKYEPTEYENDAYEKFETTIRNL